MMLPLYLLASRLAGPVARIWLARRARRGKEDRARLAERFGRASRPRPPGRLIWIHAASVGEATSALPLMRALQTQDPGIRLLMTTATVTSAARMAELMPTGAIHQYLPVDTAISIRRFLSHWRPDLAILIESELWPRLICDCKRRGVPLALVNARISEATLQKWKKAPRMARALLGAFRLISAQGPETSGRLAALGVRSEEGPNLKALVAPPEAEEAALGALRAEIAGRRVWLAASTHPGEDEIAADVARSIPDSLTIIAPRHPERGEEIARLCARRGLSVARRSRGETPGKADVYIADTLGEMGLWYRLAPLALVGGSLVPAGGHTPFEPAALGCGILYGPHIDNFRSVYGAFLRKGAVEEVEGVRDIRNAVTRLVGKDGTPAPDLVEMTEAAALVRQELGADLEPLTLRLLAMAELHAGLHAGPGA